MASRGSLVISNLLLFLLIMFTTATICKLVNKELEEIKSRLDMVEVSVKDIYR